MRRVLLLALGAALAGCSPAEPETVPAEPAAPPRPSPVAAPLPMPPRPPTTTPPSELFNQLHEARMRELDVVMQPLVPPEAIARIREADRAARTAMSILSQAFAPPSKQTLDAANAALTALTAALDAARS